jgi:3-deoxy-D-manno-octulosonic-acid transferase
MIYLYLIFSTLLTLALAPFFAAWSLVTGKKRRGLWNHFGLVPRSADTKLTIWLYALSKGEVTAAEPVLKIIRQERPDIRIIVSVTTDSGYDAASKQAGFADLIIFHPFDGWLFPAIALSRIQPDLFILTETGFWQGFLHLLGMRNIPALLFHGRISEKSMRTYNFLKPLAKGMFNSFRILCMQNHQGQEEMIKFGVDPARLKVIGDTKYDALKPVSIDEQNRFRNTLNIPGKCPVIVAGSTHEGEEEIILESFQQLQAKHPDVLLILAPRRTERVSSIINLLKDRNIPFVQRSKLGETRREKESVIILDSMGELFALYSLCDVAFVGRSLIAPGGGHSLIEPASLGKVVLHGPYMEYNQSVADELGEHGVAITVRNSDELTNKINTLLTNREESLSQKARNLIEEKKGAAKRMADLIFNTLKK